MSETISDLRAERDAERRLSRKLEVELDILRPLPARLKELEGAIRRTSDELTRLLAERDDLTRAVSQAVSSESAADARVTNLERERDVLTRHVAELNAQLLTTHGAVAEWKKQAELDRDRYTAAANDLSDRDHQLETVKEKLTAVLDVLGMELER